MTSTNPLPFEQWHPDAQRQCGYWWDLSLVACGRCNRCVQVQAQKTAATNNTALPPKEED